MSATRRLVGFLVTAAIGGVVLWLADGLLQPVPVPAGGAVVGGLVALWVPRAARPLWTTAGVLAGLGAGVAVHVRVHMTGGSPDPAGGLAGHLAVDALEGLVVAVVALLPAAVGVALLIRRSSGSRPAR